MAGSTSWSSRSSSCAEMIFAMVDPVRMIHDRGTGAIRTTLGRERLQQRDRGLERPGGAFWRFRGNGASSLIAYIRPRSERPELQPIRAVGGKNGIFPDRAACNGHLLRAISSAASG